MNNRYMKTFYNEYNNTEYSNNKYSDVFDDDFNKKVSISNEKQYEKKINHICISSRDRDNNVYPDVNRYVIDLNTELKNIVSIELIQAIIPAKNNVEEEPYLLLKINEIDDVLISNDKNISDSFAILQLTQPTSVGGFIQIDKRIHEHTVKYYKTPKASLKRFTISILDCVGNLFNFGTDTNIQKDLQNMFVFKIVTLENDRKDINFRNI